MMTRELLVTSAVGILSGVISGVVLSRTNHAQSSIQSTVATTTSAQHPESHRIDQLVRNSQPLASLEQQSALLGRPADSAGDAGTRSSARDSASTPAVFIEPAEAARQTAERRRQWIESHNLEPRDPAWAAQSENSFYSDLQRLGEVNHFSSVGVDCRTTSCIATIHWNTYDEAEQTYHSLLHGSYTVNACSRTILLPDPADRTAGYDAVLQLGCEDARAAADE